jgi:hypothetical protein
MRINILNVGRALTHSLIENGNLFGGRAFCDYDALILDSLMINAQVKELKSSDQVGIFQNRRKAEIERLLSVNGGLVICFLTDKNANLCSLLPIKDFPYVAHQPGGRAIQTAFNFPNDFQITERIGKNIQFVLRSHPFRQFFDAFQGDIQYESIIKNIPPLGGAVNQKIIAQSKVNDVIALDFPLLKGNIIFLPLPQKYDGDKIGSVLVNCIRNTLSFESVSVSPAWLSNYSLPSENIHQPKIDEIDGQLKLLSEQKEAFLKEQEEIKHFKKLLYETGKHQLEPIVRKAFRMIGFNVLEPDEYEGQHDLSMSANGQTVIGEIEGTTNQQVDVGKYRQLLDYVQDMIVKGQTVKGILVGNAKINEPPETRGEQFTTAAIQGCNSQGYCRITTYALYKIVEAILGAPSGEKNSLKAKILNEIISFNQEYMYAVPALA